MTHRPSPVPTAVAAASVILFAVWLAGQVFRDWVWLTALCFYFPSPLAALLLAGVALLAVRWKRWRIAGAAGLLALGPLAVTLFVENQWLPPPAPAEATEAAGRLRLVHWNVAEGGLGWPWVAATLKGLAPDACVLSEAGDDAALTALVAALGEGYRAGRRGGLAFLARGRLALGEAGSFAKARWVTADWESDGVRLKVLAADLPSDLTAERGPLLEAVKGVVAQTGPDLVVGDFNAPRRSWGLSELPAGYAHAYERAGSGWSYSWPVPFPALAIDQCLVGPRVAALRYELRTTAASDHRLQVLDFALSGL